MNAAPGKLNQRYGDLSRPQVVDCSALVYPLTLNASLSPSVAGCRRGSISCGSRSGTLRGFRELQSRKSFGTLANEKPRSPHPLRRLP